MSGLNPEVIWEGEEGNSEQRKDEIRTKERMGRGCRGLEATASLTEKPVMHRLVYGFGWRARRTQPRHLVEAPGDGREVTAQPRARADRGTTAQHRLIPVVGHDFSLVLLSEAVLDAAPREPCSARVRVCACVRDRERERERDAKSERERDRERHFQHLNLKKMTDDNKK